MYSLQKQAKAVKNDLKRIHIEATIDGVTVVVSAEQEIISINIDNSAWENLKTDEFGKKKMEETFIKALNKAMKKAQDVASTKMKGIWDQMGAPQA